MEIRQIAQGVYAVISPYNGAAVATAENHGFVANLGFVIGDAGVLVFDSGPNLLVAAALQVEIRKRTALPVVAVFNSHSHPENVLGNAQFSRSGKIVWAHAATRQLMRSRCPRCRANFVATMGQEFETLTPVVLAQRIVNRTGHLKIGGRDVLLYTGNAGHLPGNLALCDVKTGALFAGGLLTNQVIPDMSDADINAWVALLNSIASGPCARGTALGDRGEPGLLAELIPSLGNYLRSLHTQIEHAFDSGVDLIDVSQHVRMPDYATWALYEQLHVRNAAQTFLRVERARFEAPK